MKKKLLLLVSLIPIVAVGQSVSFSHPTGYYADSFLLSLSSSGVSADGCTIRYTLNGFDPTATSKVYCSPIQIDTTCFSQHQLYTIRNCPPAQWNPPDTVAHIIVVRAAIFDSLGNRISSIQTATYFIQKLCHKSLSLPILSICVDSAALLSQDSGIFVPGIYFDPNNDQWTGNYYQSGRQWERMAHLDYFSPTDDVLSLHCGIRTHGGNSRRFMQKGFTLYAREEYGKKNFGYAFFPNTNFKKYKRLCLKPLASSWTDAGIQDWLSQLMARGLQFDHLAVRPITLYLNGEYWGIYLLEEKPDEHFVDNHYGYDDDEVDIIGNWFGLIENGMDTGFRQLMDFVSTSDLSSKENYQHLCKLIDLPAFIDYQLFEMFIGNYDWPANNTRCWQYRDTPWRWIYYDGDGAMGSVNSMDNIFCEDEGDGWPSNAQSTLLFRSLLTNSDFSHKVLRRMTQLFKSLDPGTIAHLIDSTQSVLATEIPYQIARFGFPKSVTSWNEDILNIRTYFSQVPQAMQSKLNDKINHNHSLEIYPNPIKTAFTAYFYSVYSGSQKVIVYDALGRNILTEDKTVNKGPNIIQFHLNLPNGIYVIFIGNQSARFIVCNL